MLALRKLDRSGVHAYLDDIRPRMLVVRVRGGTGRVRFAWLVPLWPFEQLLAMAAGVALLAQATAPIWAGAAGERLSGLRARLAGVDGLAGPAGRSGANGSTLAAVAASLSAIAGSHLGDILKLPPGVPYVSVRARDANIDVTAY